MQLRNLEQTLQEKDIQVEVSFLDDCRIRSSKRYCFICPLPGRRIKIGKKKSICFEFISLCLIFKDLVSELMGKNNKIKQLNEAILKKSPNMCIHCKKLLPSSTSMDDSLAQIIDPSIAAKVLLN